MQIYLVMKRLIHIVILLLSTTLAFGQTHRINTMKVQNQNYYPIITYLSAGEPDEQGRFYRVIIYTEEIYDTVIIEGLTFGEEGGNVKIVSKRKVDLNALWTTFHLNGEIAGLEFGRWITPTSFTLKVLNKTFLIKNVNSLALTVSKL